MKRWVALLLIVILSLPIKTVAGTITEQFHGIGYGPFHQDEQDPNKYTPIPSSQIREDLRIICSTNFIHVRMFGLDNGLDQVPDIAKTVCPRLKIWLGVNESSVNHDDPNDTHATRWQLDRAISLANTYENVAGIILGDECLKGDARAGDNWITVKQLLADLAYVSQGLLPAIRNRVVLTTDLSWAAAHGNTSDSNGNILQQLLADHQNIDVWMINIYPFYKPGGITACDKNAIYENLNWNYNEFNGIYGSTGKPIVIGEHGWPTDGGDYGISHPSFSNQECYFRFSSSWIREKNWSAFYFEMFDEPWKAKSQEPGGIGPHWGLCYSSGIPKWNLPRRLVPILPPLLFDEEK
ncbi:MAG: hypothetical protein C4567_09920 [Deltaproteobacteria bacterium]|nr:MAG: hypothetical protein C4567_09920 [Deltaproteobacteria bacterium]